MDSFLISALTTAGYSLPELLACGVGLGLLWTSAQAGKPRRLGLAGLGLMLGCAVLQLAIGLFQTWVIHDLQGQGGNDLTRVFGALGIVRMLVNCVSLAGLLMLAWGLCLATRPPKASAAPASRDA